MPEHCARCHDGTAHRVLDENGSAPMCRLCLLVLIGELARSGVAVTVVANQPVTAVRS